MSVSLTSEEEIVEPLPETTPHETSWRVFVRRFLRSKPGVIGAAIVAILIVVALVAPLIAPYDPLYQDINSVTQAPGAKHLLGTDDLGRDELSRIIFGSRVTLEASILSVGIALIIGVPLGLIAGYYRGFWDEWIIMRIVDALQAFPFLILALAIAATLGPGLVHASIAIGIGFIPGFVRIVRGQVLSVASQDYVLAAKLLGTRDIRILRSHVLPNSMAPLLVQTSVALASVVLAEAALSFLGLGVQPPTASWGQMLSVAQGYINTAPWLAYWPGIAIFLAVLGFNLLGDGVRDALDPRLN
ncbi:MAG: ABC transporter permease [Chloroflexi bacterium]|nr:ABC transporter permease [Chloroflexota bacterium]